jgi:hypothetical protein
MATTPNTLYVDLVPTEGSVERLRWAAELGAREARIATLRELAEDLNARADVLEAAGKVEEAGKYNVYASALCAGSCCEDC